MEAEKVYQKKVSHTTQHKRGGGSKLGIADSRSNGILQGMADRSILRMGLDDDETVQGNFTEPVQKKNETGLPDNLKAGIEGLSGFSMDDVRVHYNSSKPSAVQALAYTQGTDIHVAPGQERHLPHEAWHVAQQMTGRVVPTTEVGGLPVNDNAGLEHEADVMGARANNF